MYDQTTVAGRVRFLRAQLRDLQTMDHADVATAMTRVRVDLRKLGVDPDAPDAGDVQPQLVPEGPSPSLIELADLRGERDALLLELDRERAGYAAQLERIRSEAEARCAAAESDAATARALAEREVTAAHAEASTLATQLRDALDQVARFQAAAKRARAAKRRKA